MHGVAPEDRRQILKHTPLAQLADAVDAKSAKVLLPAETVRQLKSLPVPKDDRPISVKDSSLVDGGKGSGR